MIRTTKYPKRHGGIMIHKKEIFGVFILPLVLCVSCLYTRSSASLMTRSATIKIALGRATVKINGEVTENLYHSYPYRASAVDGEDYGAEKQYGVPAIPEKTITKNETFYMSTGEEHKLSILPTEVVTVNITSLDSNDVEVVVYQYGREKKHTVQGANTLGLFLSFQNR
jgi:hypothetical protein